jgi:NTE family protein
VNDKAGRIALVLGAGGPVGHAYHAGLLRALHRNLGWDARSADLVLGTSAGAQVGALLRAGMSADDLTARVTGEAMTTEGAAIAGHFIRPSHDDPSVDKRPYRPAALEYLRAGLVRPWRMRPGRLAAALLPEGRVSLDAQVLGLQDLFGFEWPRDPLWITAVELATGRRVAFGRVGDPQTDVGTAVASSGAVPAVCVPPLVDGQRYVDGGMASPTNLDLLEQHDVDTIVVSSPLSVIHPIRLLLWREVRRLRRLGKKVIVFEPRGPAAWMMGYNVMDLGRAPRVAHMAYSATSHEFDRPGRRDELEALLAGPRAAPFGLVAGAVVD